MNHVNSVTLQGYLTRDAYKTDTSLLFTIASSSSYKDRNTDEWVDRADFIDCSLFNPTEYQSANLTKGAHVIVEGNLSSYNKELEGVKRTFVQVRVRRINILPRAEKQAAPNGKIDFAKLGPPTPPQRAATQPRYQRPPARPPVTAPADDDFAQYAEVLDWTN